MTGGRAIRSAEAVLPAAELVRRFRDPEKFLAFCRQCSRYGKCWACPPFGSGPDLSGYGDARLIGTVIFPEERAVEEVRRVLDRRLLEEEAAHPGSRAFFAGTCLLCPECARKDSVPCRCPEKVRPSLEALGFDLETAAREVLGFEMKWGRDGKLPEYIVLVSALFYAAEEKGRL